MELNDEQRHGDPPDVEIERRRRAPEQIGGADRDREEAGDADQEGAAGGLDRPDGAGIGDPAQPLLRRGACGADELEPARCGRGVFHASAFRQLPPAT